MRFSRAARLVSVVSMFALLFVSACGGTTDDTDTVHQEVVGATVSTDMTNYTTNQSITVSWSGMPGNPNDWVAIATAGSPSDSGIVRWNYTGGLTSGSNIFANLPAGAYQARAYLDSSTTLLATSAFTVGSSASVSTDMTMYPSNAPVTVSWNGMPGNQNDWVAIVTAGSPPDSGFVRWNYINGQTSGMMTYTGIADGNYEARTYLNGSFSILATSTFSIGGGPTATITTDQTMYTTGSPVVVSWTGLPGNPGDWIAIVAAGSPPDSGFVKWNYTGGGTSGQMTFNGIANGSYEARAYLNGSFTVLASATFSIATSMSTTITTDKQVYSANEAITVTWAGMPGNTNDWVALATAGSPVTSGIISWNYINGQTSGSMTFAGLPNGNYEARAYLNGSYTELAVSTFTVNVLCTSATTRPVFGSITSGDLVISNTQTGNTAPLTAPLASSILFTSLGEDETSPLYGGVLCTLHDVDMTNMLPAGVTCDRNAAGTDNPNSNGSITVHYTVVTFTSGVTVQRGVANTGFTNPASVALTTIDPTQSFVLLNGMFNGGTGWGNNEFVKASIVDAQTLSVGTNASGTSAAWQVVSMVGASVQRGSASFASGDTTQTAAITTAPTGSVVFASYTTDNASGIAASAMMMRSSLTDPNTVTFARDGSGSSLSVAWEVVSLPFATTSGVASFAVGETTKSATVANISATSSVGVSSSEALLGQSTGSTTYAGSDLDLVGEAAASLTTGANSVSLTRATSLAAATIPWTVIDFAHDCTGM